MDQSITKSLHVRRSSEEICRLLDEFKKAGVSVQAFCNMHSIGKGAFYKWQSRYKTKQKEQPVPKGFADIHIIPSAENPASLFAEVKGVKLYQHVTAAYLKELVS